MERFAQSPDSQKSHKNGSNIFNRAVNGLNSRFNNAVYLILGTQSLVVPQLNAAMRELLLNTIVVKNDAPRKTSVVVPFGPPENDTSAISPFLETLGRQKIINRPVINEANRDQENLKSQKSFPIPIVPKSSSSGAIKIHPDKNWPPDVARIYESLNEKGIYVGIVKVNKEQSQLAVILPDSSINSENAKVSADGFESEDLMSELLYFYNLAHKDLNLRRRQMQKRHWKNRDFRRSSARQEKHDNIKSDTDLEIFDPDYEVAKDEYLTIAKTAGIDAAEIEEILKVADGDTNFLDKMINSTHSILAVDEANENLHKSNFHAF